jgi:hypothetical protein
MKRFSSRHDDRELEKVFFDCFHKFEDESSFVPTKKATPEE